MNRRFLDSILREQDLDASGLKPLCITPTGTFFTLTIPGDEAEAVWHALRGCVDETGHWPVICPLRASLGYKDEHVKDLIAYLESDAVRHVITASEAINPVSWLERKRAMDLELIEEDGDDPDEFFAELEGTWPTDARPSIGFTVTEDEVVELHLLPTTVSWHVPAFYQYGGASTPEPAEHVAVHKYWHDNIGAEMLGYRGDLIEMHVRQPPQSREEALALAWKHYGYCSDVVIQGMQTVARLAGTLLHGTAWYFWWD